MLYGESLGLLLGAVGLGAVHGVEPGHGWPVAASYAVDQTRPWLYGLAASLLLGVGHLVSSIAMVLAFFYAKSYFELAQVDEPIRVAGGVAIGGPVSVAAGVLLVALGVREYRHGHSHGSGDGHERSHGDAHVHPHGTGDGHSHDDGHHDSHGDDHAHDSTHSHGFEHDPDADRGLLGIAWVAFLLGFAHEEEFEIIALCAGSTHCLELMSAYALTVIAGIVAITLLLVAGYAHYEARVERYTPHLPAFSAAVLVAMGIGFITGLF
ncbi:MAG: hypothetical protein ABEJ42_06840 [Halobacteriaceae archaeon]